MYKVIAVAISICLTGCASRSFVPRFQQLGEYKDTSAIEKSADKMKWADAEEIKVFVGDLPKGINNKDGKVEIENKDKYEVLGIAGADIGGKYYPEDESWRNGWCGWQQPLIFLTLFTWALVPTYYPCMVRETNSIEDVNERKNRVVHTLKKVAKAAGGDLVVITEMGKTATIDSQTKVVLSETEMTSAKGYVLKTKK